MKCQNASAGAVDQEITPFDDGAERTGKDNGRHSAFPLANCELRCAYSDKPSFLSQSEICFKVVPDLTLYALDRENKKSSTRRNILQRSHKGHMPVEGQSRLNRRYIC